MADISFPIALGCLLWWRYFCQGHPLAALFFDDGCCWLKWVAVRWQLAVLCAFPVGAVLEAVRPVGRLDYWKSVPFLSAGVFRNPRQM